MGLYTFIISNVVIANGWDGFANANVGRDRVAKMNMDCEWKCSMCEDIVWYNDTTQRSYDIIQNGGSLAIVQLLADIEADNWSTLPLLFDGAYDFTVAGNMGKALSFIYSGGTIGMSCMSPV